MKSCSLCRKSVDAENAPILTMGGFGNPRYLCDECASDIECALYESEPDRIEAAMQRLSKKLAADPDDKATMEAVGDVFSKAGERAKKIREGTYDFSEDTDGEFDEIPEELQETEEDRIQDEKDAERAKKFDKISNWITTGVLILAVAFLIIYFIKK